MKRRKSRGTQPQVADSEKPSPIVTDPQGCYTGKPIERFDTPVQDVDDL